MRIDLIVVLAVLASPIQAQVTPPSPPAIVTSAEAHADVAPDRAAILVTVETHGSTAAAAAADNARYTRATLDTLRTLGLSHDQIGTFGFSVTPQYVPQTKVPGYVARNTVRVVIKKIDDVGKAIDVALAGGANSIGSLQFSASNVDSARRDALARATAQARGDAEALAKAAGGVLGPLIEISGSANDGVRPIMYSRVAAMAAVGTAPTPIDAGPITVTASVNVRWQFVPANR